MKVSVQISEKEKKIALVLLAVAALIAYLFNRKYLYILEAENEDGVIKKLLLKTGFILPVKTEIDLKNEPTEQTVKYYEYVIKTSPVKDEKGNGNGEFELLVFKNKKDTKPWKTVKIFKDDYYVKHLKTPLGRI